MPDKCNICNKPGVGSDRDDIGRLYTACRTHLKYLAGWIRDANMEMANEGAESLRNEREHY